MATQYIVRYRSLDCGFPMYQGGPGLDVNAGVRMPTSSVMRAEDAVRYRKLATAKRHAYRCNSRWYGEVLEADTREVVFTIGRGRKIGRG